MPPRHRFLEPIHNVKEGEHRPRFRAPKHAKIWSSYLEKVAALPPPVEDGGASRDRTDDLKLAKLALSQLSYGPAPIVSGGRSLAKFALGGPRRS